MQTNLKKKKKLFIIKVFRVYDHGQLDVKLPKKEYGILTLQDSNKLAQS